MSQACGASRVTSFHVSMSSLIMSLMLLCRRHGHDLVRKQ